MKVTAFNCSPRKNGNTAHMLMTVLSVLEENGIETELVQVGGADMHTCHACGRCKKNLDGKCVQDDDALNGFSEKMVASDGIIIGSPTYYADISPEAKILIDRVGYSCKTKEGNPLRRKVGAAVIAVRRAGSIHAFDSINHFFLINEMVVPGSTYWNMSLARAPGDYENDAEGVATMKALGENMAWLLKKME
ncbi:MAG: flavodoxin family protein [Candidatus Methanomethylophilaceae archaeon]